MQHIHVEPLIVDTICIGTHPFKFIMWRGCPFTEVILYRVCAAELCVCCRSVCVCVCFRCVCAAEVYVCVCASDVCVLQMSSFGVSFIEGFTVVNKD